MRKIQLNYSDTQLRIPPMVLYFQGPRPVAQTSLRRTGAEKKVPSSDSPQHPRVHCSEIQVE